MKKAIVICFFLVGCQDENKFEKELRELKVKNAVIEQGIDRSIDSLEKVNKQIKDNLYIDSVEKVLKSL